MKKDLVLSLVAGVALIVVLGIVVPLLLQKQPLQPLGLPEQPAAPLYTPPAPAPTQPAGPSGPAPPPPAPIVAAPTTASWADLLRLSAAAGFQYSVSASDGRSSTVQYAVSTGTSAGVPAYVIAITDTPAAGPASQFKLSIARNNGTCLGLSRTVQRPGIPGAAEDNLPCSYLDSPDGAVLLPARPYSERLVLDSYEALTVKAGRCNCGLYTGRGLRLWYDNGSPVPLKLTRSVDQVSSTMTLDLVSSYGYGGITGGYK